MLLYRPILHRRVLFRYSPLHPQRFHTSLHFNFMTSVANGSYAQEPVASSTAHQGKLASIDLSEYDPEQSKLMDERCIVVDENDVAIGALDKKTCMSQSAPTLSRGTFTFCSYRPFDGKHQKGTSSPCF
jgi:hypothetical protein